MKIDTIILDLDDVLNTCTASIAQMFGVRLKTPDDLSWFNPKFGWDIVKAVSHALRLPPDSPIPVPDFWNRVPAEFWASIPKSNLCDYIIRLTTSLVGRNNVIIATSCTKDSMSYGYKHRWMVDNLPEFMHRQFHITPCKQFLSRPGTLLIDDRWDNCKLALERGGDALCWPKPWNEAWTGTPATMLDLAQYLQTFEYANN